MTEDIFDLTLNKIHEFTQAIESEKRDCGVRVSFCGLGEPCLHPNLAQYISRVVDAGVNPGMASNASQPSLCSVWALLSLDGLGARKRKQKP